MLDAGASFRIYGEAVGTLPDIELLAPHMDFDYGFYNLNVSVGSEHLDAFNRQVGVINALAFGIDHLEVNPPDVVIVVDADCRLTPGSVDALLARATRTERPVQADNVLQPAERTPLSMISALATLVRNRVRPRGLRRLGQPCHLTGTGMALPWKGAC